MIDLLKRLLPRRAAPDAIRATEARAFLATPPAPMREVRPPQAVNDDPLRPLYQAVERELRVAGLIG